MKAVCCALALLCLSRWSFAADALAPAAPPSTQPADRSTPIGACRLYDQTVADIGVDAAMKFYHCTSAAQLRYARSECEFYVALNRLVRSISTRLGDDAGSAARRDLGDSNDYSTTTVDAEGDSATLQRQGAKPMQLIRIDDKWCFSMPDWFALQTTDTLAATRAYYESSADQLDAAREQIEAGKLRSLEEIEELLQKIAATR